MTDAVGSNGEEMRKLRHDLSNPLSAILAETQLLLLNPESLNDETAPPVMTVAVRLRKPADCL